MIPPMALAAVPGATLAGPAPRVTGLEGGLLNRSFRVETGAGIFVLRLNASSGLSRQLGINRRLEVELQGLAAIQGLAPQIVAVAGDDSYLVQQYVPGASPDAGQWNSAGFIARFGATLQQVHAIRPSAALRGPSLIERTRRLVQCAIEVSTCTAAPLQAALVEAECGWRAARSDRLPCLVHSDPHPGNVVCGDEDSGAVLLDWEYAHIGDPLQDVAAWLQGSPALRGREAELLRACDLHRQADPAMLAGMLAVHAALEMAWIRVVETVAGIPGGGRAN